MTSNRRHVQPHRVNTVSRGSAAIQEREPPALLVAVTDEAKAALAQYPFVRMTAYPFKIGRESRSVNPLARVVTTIERRLSTIPQLNDLYLIEPPGAATVQISRQHCAIEWTDGRFSLIDRGSMCGTMVIPSRLERHPTGVATTDTGRVNVLGRTPLDDGDLIVIGDEDSPYVFRFEVDLAILRT